MSQDAGASATPALSATYSSPASEPFTLTTAVPAPPTPSVADKTAYLQALRAAVAKTQDHVNRELTTRMEQDKAREAAGEQQSGRAAKLAVDEDKEEANYGEEVVDDDDDA